MNAPSPALQALARRYERSQAGRTGTGSRDLLVALEDLLQECGCAEGEARALAEQQLRAVAAAGLLTLEPIHRRDRSAIDRIRFSPENEARFYTHLGQPSPRERRERLAAQFGTAARLEVPERWRADWAGWCEAQRAAALAGEAVVPFDRDATPENEEILALLPKLLAWEGESLVRFASCVLCGTSKRLQELAAREGMGEHPARLRGRVGRLLEAITGGRICSLDDLGITENPRYVQVHGPIKLFLGGRWLDLGMLEGPFRISQLDVDRIEAVETLAERCLTVENETSFHELAKLQSGELLVSTSYPGSGTVRFLQRLPATLEYWHFGDSDEHGFEILRVLREKTGRDFQPLHMAPGRVPFEQESLGRPVHAKWPFYSE